MRVFSHNCFKLSKLNRCDRSKLSKIKVVFSNYLNLSISLKISFKTALPVSLQSFCGNISDSISLFDLVSLVDGSSWFTTEETSDGSSITMGVDSWIPALLLVKVWSFCKGDVDFGSVFNNVEALLLVVDISYVDDIGTFCCEVANGGNTLTCGWPKGWFKDGWAVIWLFRSGLEYTGLDCIGDVDSCNVTCSDVGDCFDSWIKKRNSLHFYKKFSKTI